MNEHADLKQPCLAHEWRVEGDRLVCGLCPILGPPVVEALRAILVDRHPSSGTPTEKLATTDRAIEEARAWLESLLRARVTIEAAAWAHHDASTDRESAK